MPVRKIADDADELAGDLLVRVLRQHHQPRADAQIEGLDEARSDVGREPVVLLQVASLDDLLVERTERRLDRRIDTQDLRRAGAGGRGGKPVDGQPVEDVRDALGDRRRFDRVADELQRAARQTVFDLAADAEVGNLHGHVSATGPDPGVDPLLVLPVPERLGEGEQRAPDDECGRGEDGAPQVAPQVAQRQHQDDAEMHGRSCLHQPFPR